MRCSSCGNPLRVLRGGSKSPEGSTKVIAVHIFGCMNDKCELKGKEQSRTETEQESFVE